MFHAIFTNAHELYRPVIRLHGTEYLSSYCRTYPAQTRNIGKFKLQKSMKCCV